jgi:hypothetical protein
MVVRLRLDPTAADGLLGLWSDQADPADIAFTGPTDVQSRDAETVWQVRLPANETSARQLLDQSQQALERSRQQLTGLPAAVEGWLADGARREARVEVAFSAQTETAEQDLEDAVEGLGHLVRVGAPVAWVETQVAERLLARSRITFAGELTTVVAAAESAALAGHERSLALAAASRIAALQAAAATVRAAVAIATRLSLPGGPLLALPLAWRLLRRDLAPPASAGGP